MLAIRPTRLVHFRRPASVLAALAFSATTLAAQAHITTPKEFFGHNVGDDYFLANYTQFQGYWHKIDGESNRMRVEEIGKTAEGRPQLMAIITSPENFARLDHYKEISKKLALAEGVTEDQARALAKEGKSVVWIDGGLHATEVVGTQQLIETSYQLVSRNDEETQRILRDDIILLVHVNPDGMELVSNWYMKDADTLKRNMQIPRLYQKYIGHDDNRDFYMLNQPETVNDARIAYHEWFPQIVYNHHQAGPAGTVIFTPPFRDPFNYNFDPMIPIGVDIVGAAMHDRFLREGKPGFTMRSGSSYSTWWNGGLRTLAYFHNMIGLLTEIIGNPTPQQIPLVMQFALPRADIPFPIAPQPWHFRQSIDYEITDNYAVLDIASKRKEDFLFNIWRMGMNSIQRGSKDTWTIHPSLLDSLQAQIDKDRLAANAAGGNAGGAAGRGGRGGGRGAGGADISHYYADFLHDPARRDPRGYIIPADQPDFLTATKFVNALRKVNVSVQRATASFTVKGKTYPAGTYVVKTAQAFRPHVLDMFEPQDHPNDFAYPGGPPRPPYDNAGYTLAYMMGVKFDRVLDGFDCPCTKIEGMAVPPAGAVAGATNVRGLLLNHEANDAFIAVNRALKAGAAVYWLKSPMTANGHTYPTGSFYIEAPANVRAIADKSAKDLGVSFDGTAEGPSMGAQKLKTQRIALWDQYGGSMPSGQTRWLLEQFEFPFDVVYPQTLDAGNLHDKYDVIIFVTGAIPAPPGMGARGGRGGGGGAAALAAAGVATDAPPGGGFGRGGPNPEDIPAEFRGWLGRITPETTIPQLKKFLDDGGTIITIGTSTSLAFHLGLPVRDYMVERSPNGQETPLPREKFYVPGSVMKVSVDNSLPIAAGFGKDADVFFDDSPVFRLEPDAALKGVRPIAWYPSAHTLRSGWAWGQNYLEGGAAMVQADVGKGKLFLFGPEILFRAQPHGTFKFLFNGIYAGSNDTKVVQ
jgi:zinc carboxypeptidase